MTTSPISHATTQEQRVKQPHISSEEGVDTRDFEENTMLIKEATLGNEGAVRSLLAKGANPDAQNVFGYTALLVALSKGFSKIAMILLEFGANVHISTLEGLTALHMAIYCDESVLVQVLQCGAFLGAQDEEGDTVLHWVVREGKQDILSFLLTKISFLDIKNEDGETPLHFAASFGEETMVELFLKNGATPDIKDNNGLTPAEHALENSHYRIAHLLSKVKRHSNNTRHEPYRRSCGDVHGEYERKRLSQHLLPSDHLIPAPTHFC